MSATLTKESRLLLEKGDLTLMEIEAIVFYARQDLVIGSGTGNAITVRGGGSIQEELKSFGRINTCEAVITSAGNLKASYIIHAVGPRFQEPGTEEKLRKTIENVLTVAEKNKIKKIGFPPMGTGFYGIPLDLCAKVMLDTLRKFLAINTSLDEIVICVMDKRELDAFRKFL